MYPCSVRRRLCTERSSTVKIEGQAGLIVR